MDFNRIQHQQWPSSLSSTALSTSLTAPNYSLHRSRSPSPPTRAQPPSSIHPLQPFSNPVVASSGSLLHSSSNHDHPSTSPSTSPTLKRNSGGSSASSGSGGLLDTSQWRSTNNVYIKGLPEKCSNEDLQLWAEQVAKPVSVKTIRDARDHSICTGLGFVRFALPAQAKLFIALVNAVDGYEACFAKETYVGKMDKAADPRSANLYLSHIPLTYTEQDILALFPSPQYIVRSLRLLHEGDQPGQRAPPGTPFKGAGFIRLDTREMAERAIAELNGKRLPGHGRRPGRSKLPNGEIHSYYDTLQVRFADTEVQKQIKSTESELEKIHAMELSGQLPPRSRKGQAYRRLSFSTEQKIRNSGRKGRRGSGVAVPGGTATTGLGISFTGGNLPTPPSSFGSLGLPVSRPPQSSQGFSSIPSFYGSSMDLLPPRRSITPGFGRSSSTLPYAPPNSPVNDSLLSSPVPYSSDYTTPPSLGGFSSSAWSGSGSPASFSSISPVPLSSSAAFISAVPGSNTFPSSSSSSFGTLPPVPPARRGSGAFESGLGSNPGLGLTFEGSGMPYSLESTGIQPYSSTSSQVSQGMLALQAQQERINRSIANIDRLTGRRSSDATYNINSLEGMNSMFIQSNFMMGSSYGEDEELNEASATYDLSKLGFAPPSTPPPDSSHPFFEDASSSSLTTNNDRRITSNNNRPSSRNHQRAHTTAARLNSFPATPTSYDPDYSPSKLLAPASALARRSSAVEERIARRRV